MSKVHLTYDPSLTIAENARLADVSISAVKKYMTANHVSSRLNNHEYRIRILSDVIATLKADGVSTTVKNLCEYTKWSNKTVLKYLGLLQNDGVDMDTQLPFNKVSMFALNTNERIIKAVSSNEHTILANILKLYNHSERVNADLTYSKGHIWRNLPEPSLKYDIHPQSHDIEYLDVAEALNDEVFSSVLFDLPFIVRITSTTTSLINNRFEAFQSKEELFTVNTKMLELSWRLLVKDGLLIVKTGDCVYANKQILTHVFLINEATRLGFSVEDLFILHRNNVILSPNVKKMRHARKNYCYYLVFRKK